MIRPANLWMFIAVVSMGCGGSSSQDAPATDSGAAADADAATADSPADTPGTESSDATPDTPAAPCTSIDDCAGATPRCDTARKACAGCLTDADCRGGLHCYAATGECRDCVTDAHCKAPTPYCDFASTRQCTTKCTKDSDCPGPTGSLPSHCDKAAGVCVDCLLGSHCGGGFCELPTHSCVGCLKDTDCPKSDPRCGPSLECTPTCATETDCTGGLHCDLGAGACVECVVNKHCPGGMCQVDHTCG